MRRLILSELVLLLSLGCDPESTAQGPGTAPAIVQAGEPALRRVPVQSSFIDSVGYHAGSRTLEMEMNQGRSLYRYHEVPPEVFDGLMGASSKGQFFNANIRGQYRMQRLR